MANEFVNTLPEWKNEGTEPPEQLKTSGFQVKQKPPAAYFNWFWCKVTKCIKELQTIVSKKADATVVDAMTDKVEIAYKYKGSVDTYGNLPNTHDLGDVYKVNAAFENSIKAMHIDVVSIDTSYVNDGGFLILECVNGTFDNNLDNCNVTVYDSVGTRIGNGLISCGSSYSHVQVFGVSNLSVGEYYVEFPSGTDWEYYNGTTLFIIKINPGDCVYWNGSKWETFVGVIDTSNLAPKATTLAGYGIRDAYTKDEVNSMNENNYLNTQGSISNLSIKIDNKIQYSTQDLTAGTDYLDSGSIYVVYE